MELKENIEQAKIMCQGKYIYEEFDEFFKFIYPFATENIDGYIRWFNLRNKSLLTVGSSSDQVLSAIAYGCNDVTLVDINPFIKYYYYLKVAAIMNLSLDDYITFLKKFDYKGYCKLHDSLSSLDEETVQFWDALFEKFKGKKIRNRLFMKDEYNGKTIKKINSYLSDSRVYSGMKCKLQKANVKFINQSVLDLDIDNSFDNIWLSNIFSFLNISDIKKMVENMDTRLNDNGRLLINYSYDVARHYSINRIKKVLSDYEILLASFRGMDSITEDNVEATNSALIYHKKRGK